MENEIKQTMTYESRMALVSKNFVSKMSLLFQPHVRLRDNDAGGIYLQEIAEAINSRLPSEIPNNDVYTEALREIWRGVTAKHKSSYWFSLSDVIAATNKTASKYQGKYGKKKAVSFQGQAGENETRKKGEGWTLEGAQRELARTDAMIASGELGRNMGNILRRIPLKAIERLGGNVDIAPPPVQETPAEHLPADAPKPEIAKPIMAMDAGELNTRLIVDGATPPKPIDKPEFDAVLDRGGDDLPDWNSL